MAGLASGRVDLVDVDLKRKRSLSDTEQSVVGHNIHDGGHGRTSSFCRIIARPSSFSKKAVIIYKE